MAGHGNNFTMRTKKVSGRTFFWDSNFSLKPNMEKRKKYLKEQGYLIRVFRGTWVIKGRKTKRYMLYVNYNT